MSDAILHRGPDDEGEYYDAAKGVGLAHRRLSILDLSPTGHQPMISEDGAVVLVFNGEIYNFRELRMELEARGHRFRGHSDTEVLLALYMAKGEDLLPHLDGIFAFALWDARQRTLLLARDGLGVKPLYYAEGKSGLVFASELKALLRVSEVGRDVDPFALQHYLTYLWCPAPSTLLHSVKKLEPGCALVVKNGRIDRRWRFYQLPFHELPESMPESEAIHQTRDALRTAVQRQMVADVPVGAFLSGGLDSSAVVAFARELSPGRRLKCFTMEMSAHDAAWEGIANDLPYAESAARYLDVDLHTIKIGPEITDDLWKMIYHLDEPQGDPASLNVLSISRLARDHGVKVLLSGAGGDDIFTGYRRHRAVMIERYWSWMPRAVRAGMAELTARLPTSAPALRQLRKAFQYASYEGDRRLASYFYWLQPELAKKLLSPELCPPGRHEEPLLASLGELSDEVPTLNRMLYLECKHFLADHNLNYTDKLSMAAGVEVRVPLLDRELVALAARLPIQYKQRGAEGKWIFKKAMEGLLPRDIIYRPKTGFGVPLRAWLRGPLQEAIRDILSPDSLRRRGWFNSDSVE
ncbi:MAG TPA: asparagine synthase (glutamine-hydrolyzing), partial [Terriglobales bacterium]|nr:asparagine synthase (glutamine-hydrolyzing) [Terriglobales bacterium]